jgi:hypothetical protein
MASPTISVMRFSLTRFAPLAITKIGLRPATVLKTIDFAICATVHPIAAAASFQIPPLATLVDEGARAKAIASEALQPEEYCAGAS